MIHEITDPCSVLSLYDGWEETMIWSCLQGIMGKIYADGPRRPASAAAFIGDFAFFCRRTLRRTSRVPATRIYQRFYPHGSRQQGLGREDSPRLGSESPLRLTLCDQKGAGCV